ncbi:MAG: DUF4263 domain-containing protein [Phycisphaerae bacterium]|nr:DUF4263 domain-containing protein [Phycisphaerae bacterium]
MAKLSQRFRELIDDPKATERDVHSFLKAYPMIMIQLFNVSWNYYLAIPEFELGTDFRADFLVLSADSGAWHAVFVELKGPNDRIYLKDGSPSKKLRDAEKQIADWQKFCRARTDEVKHGLAKALKPRCVSAQNLLMGRGGYAHEEIELPGCFFHEQYKIVIGRRSSFADEPSTHALAPGFGYGPQVSTYDRVLDFLVDHEQNRYIRQREDLLCCDDKRSLHS